MMICEFDSVHFSLSFVPFWMNNQFTVHGLANARTAILTSPVKLIK